MKLSIPAVKLLVVLSLSSLPVSAVQEAQEVTPRHALAVGEDFDRPVDAEVEPWRVELLQLAFQTARRYPKQPHVKNQARTLERIVIGALELDQPELALSMVPANPNWRRGAGYAAYAIYCARNGFPEAARHAIDRAHEIADNEDLLGGQSWRRDRVRSAIAQAHALMGELEQAEEIERSLEIAERGRTLVVLVERVEAERFDEQLTAIRGLLDNGTFDQQKNVLLGLAATLERYYGDREKRAALLAAVQESVNWPRLPVTLRVEVLAGLANAASRSGDAETAVELLDQGRALIDERENWPAEAVVPLFSALARGRFLAGQEPLALKNAQEALEGYEAGRESVSNVFRAETLRPLAEAYWDMELPEMALGIYRRVLDEGAVNPNSWPRGDDLIDTIISMVLHEARPGAEVMGVIQAQAEAVFPQ
ncbi:MAG: hypothetical protein ACYSWX_05510 [Planctomycetota bacterium]|jgi:tetratricopeptide (TPR) repeat protein